MLSNLNVTSENRFCTIKFNNQWFQVKFFLLQFAVCQKAFLKYLKGIFNSLNSFFIIY
jgi:hypothetical protein